MAGPLKITDFFLRLPLHMHDNCSGLYGAGHPIQSVGEENADSLPRGIKIEHKL